MKLSYEDRLGSLRRHIKQGTLIRGAFTHSDKKGRATACLLAAMSPEVASSEQPGHCPAKVMPTWLAQLTPHIDDEGTDKHWFSMVTRYAEVAALWPVLSKADWFELQIRAIQIGIGEAEGVMPKELHTWFMQMHSSAEKYRKVVRQLQGKPEKKKRPRRLRHLWGLRPLRTETRVRKKLQEDMDEWSANPREFISRSRCEGEVFEELDKATWDLASVQDAWSGIVWSFNSRTAKKMCWDRMTNLLFDAIEAQVKVAQEREDIKAVQLSKRPRV